MYRCTAGICTAGYYLRRLPGFLAGYFTVFTQGLLETLQSTGPIDKHPRDFSRVIPRVGCSFHYREQGLIISLYSHLDQCFVEITRRPGEVPDRHTQSLLQYEFGLLEFVFCIGAALMR